MAETIDIRELNIMIEQQSGFVTNLVAGMDQVIVGASGGLIVDFTVERWAYPVGRCARISQNTCY